MTAGPAERRLSAQLAANSRWAQQDSHAGTEAARRAFREQFERQVDPDGTLPTQERARRAEAARRAYYAGLALKSVSARRKRREAREAELRANAALRAGRQAGGAA